MKDTKIGILNRQIWRLVLEARPYLVLAPFVSILFAAFAWATGVFQWLWSLAMWLFSGAWRGGGEV